MKKKEPPKKPERIPQDHYTINVKPNDPPIWGAIPGKYRPSPHVKVNECDH